MIVSATQSGGKAWTADCTAFEGTGSFFCIKTFHFYERIVVIASFGMPEDQLCGPKKSVVLICSFWALLCLCFCSVPIRGFGQATKIKH